MNLVFPKKQSISFSRSIFSLYDKALHSEEDELIFDLSGSESITPFSIVMHAALIKECLQKGKSCHFIRPRKKSLQRYLRDMGFNDFFWPQNGQAGFVSIERDRVQLKRPDGIDYFLADQIITVFDGHLNLSEGVKVFLQMSIREAMTITVDHSGEKRYYVCAQADKKRRKIRLCIADLGKGVYNALHPHYPHIKNDYEAIEEAIKEGISSREEKAGYGLSHIKRFIEANKGRMWIISGRGKVMWEGTPIRAKRQLMPVSFNGTIVNLVINIDRDTLYIMSHEIEQFF